MKLLIILSAFLVLTFAEKKVQWDVDLEYDGDEDFTPFEAAVALYEENGYIMDECRDIHRDCIRLATTLGQKIKCFIQLGLCMGAKVTKCSGKCVMPLITCRLTAGDSWPALFRCATQFIQCAIAGCSGSKLEVEWKGEDYTPYEAATGLLEINGGIIGECKQMHQDCLHAATSVGQKIRCFIQLGLCLGVRVAGCSKQCVMPLITCKMAAGDSWPAIFKCATDFIQCAVGGCKGATYEVDDENADYTPYEAATALMDVNGGIVTECRQMHQDCLDAATSVGQKIRCFVQLGLCLGVRVAGCSKQCVMPLVTCRMAAGDSWPAIFKCASDFIQCAVSGCKETNYEVDDQNDDYTPYEAATALMEINGGIVTECRQMHQDCLNAATSTGQKIRCFVQLGLCLGVRVAGCSKQCVMPLVTCKMAAGDSWPAIFKCATDFIQCAVSGCKETIYEEEGENDYSPYEAATGLLEANGGIVEECRQMHHDCLEAATSTGQKIRCFVQLGLCLGVRVAGCSKQCVMPLVTCRMAAGDSWPAIFKCATDFIQCAVSGCKETPSLSCKGDECFSADDVAIESFFAETQLEGGIIDQCKMMHEECMAAASGTIQKAQCFVQLGLCLGAKAARCAKECIPSMIKCKLDNIGNFPGLIRCSVDFLKCVVGECSGHHTSLPVRENDSILDQCRMMHEECLAAASGKIQTAQCYIQLGLCLGAKAASCAKECIPSMVKCKLGNIGNFPGLIKCSVEFLKCVVGECSGHHTNALVSENDSILQQCVMMHHECMAAATSIFQRVDCNLRLGLCLTAKTANCSNECIPPLMKCKLENHGNCKGLIKCSDDFRECAVGGCSDHHNNTQLSENDSILDQCRRFYDDCNKAAVGIFQKGKCIAGFGICMTAKAVDCGKDCVAPALLCHAKSIHDWAKLVKCNVDFVKCIYKSCKEGNVTSLEIELNESLDAETYSLEPNDETDVVQQCYDDMAECEKRIGHKYKCKINFFICMVARLFSCGKECRDPYWKCGEEAGKDHKKREECTDAMVSCVRKQCSKHNAIVSDDDYSPYETAISQFDANGSIIDECKVTHEDCLKAATSGSQKIQCFIQLGLCIGTKAIGCAKQCVLPLIMCRLSAGGSWEGLMKCAKEFLSCTIKGCSKEIVSDDDYSPYEAAISQFEANSSIIDECKVTHEDCIKAATSGSQKIQCFIQLGLCVGTKAIGCAKQCVLPLIMCRLSAGGSWEGLMKCAKEFLSCAIKGCSTANMSAKELSPFEAAIAEVDATNSPIGDCKKNHQACIKAAVTGSQKIKCFVSVAVCIGTKAVDCAQSCVINAVLCRFTAGGSWEALMGCAKKFIMCAVEKCTKEVADDDYSPFEAAIAHYEKNDELIPECKAAHDVCIQTITTGEDKMKCFTSLGSCLGKRLLGCGKSCSLPLVLCRLTAGGSWPALFKCGKEFLACTIKGCFKDLQIGQFQLSNDVPSFVKECNEKRKTCMSSAKDKMGKIRCTLRYYFCIANKLVDCARPCLPTLGLCRIQAGDDIKKQQQCIHDLTKCIVRHCKEENATQLIDLSNDVPIDLKKCYEESKECMRSAKDGLDWIRCALRFYLCKIFSGLAECARPCLPSLASCRKQAGDDIKKQEQCIQEFNACLANHCKKEKRTSLAVSNDKGIIAQCQALFYECKAAASGIVDQAECLVQLGLCMTAKLVDCAKDCVAPMLMCKGKAIGSFKKLLQCNVDFVKCAVGGCSNKTSTAIMGKNDPYQRAISLMAKDTEVALSIDFATCWAAHSECAKAAGSELYPRLECFIRFGICMGKEFVGCSSSCFPQFALCKYNANDDWIKISLCGVKFLWCAKKGCMDT